MGLPLAGDLVTIYDWDGVTGTWALDIGLGWMGFGIGVGPAGTYYSIYRHHWQRAESQHATSITNTMTLLLRSTHS